MEHGELAPLTEVIYGMAEIIDPHAFNLPEGVAMGPGFITRRELALQKAIRVLAYLMGHGLDIRSWMDREKPQAS